jgi:hypothetical protein
MPNHKKSDLNSRKYFTYGEGKNHLVLLFGSRKLLEEFYHALGILLREKNFPEGPGESLYFSFTGTLKNHLTQRIRLDCVSLSEPQSEPFVGQARSII